MVSQIPDSDVDDEDDDVNDECENACKKVERKSNNIDREELSEFEMQKGDE